MRKRTSRYLSPTKTLISLCNSADWSESSLSVGRNFASLTIRNAPSEDSDQTARMRRLIWIFAGCTCTKVCFLTFRLVFTSSRDSVHVVQQAVMWDEDNRTYRLLSEVLDSFLNIFQKLVFLSSVEGIIASLDVCSNLFKDPQLDIHYME